MNFISPISTLFFILTSAYCRAFNVELIKSEFSVVYEMKNKNFRETRNARSTGNIVGKELKWVSLSTTAFLLLIPTQ